MLKNMGVRQVALDQNPAKPSTYWPPSDPDQIETIAASYAPPATGDASVRFFNLSPNTKLAGLTSSAPRAAVISNIKFSLGSKWERFPVQNQTFTVVDDDNSPAVALLNFTISPVAPPIGSTVFLLGLQKTPNAIGGSDILGAGQGVQAVVLHDAPEGGVCKP